MAIEMHIVEELKSTNWFFTKAQQGDLSLDIFRVLTSYVYQTLATRKTKIMSLKSKPTIIVTNKEPTKGRPSHSVSKGNP